MGNSFHIIQMAPTKSNEKNPCCLNLCNSFFFVFIMQVTGPFNQLWSLFGQYDTFWRWWRGMALEPTFVKSWNRLVGPKVGGEAVYGQILQERCQSSTRHSTTIEKTRVSTSTEK